MLALVGLQYNGYRLDLRSGPSFSANALSNTETIPEGEYLIDGNSEPRIRAPRPQCVPREYALKPASQKSMSARYYLVLENTRMAGIRVDPTLFHTTDVGGQLLTVRYAAPWMLTARAELGNREVDGVKANPRILEYFTASKFDGKDDSTGRNAWCGSFVSWVMKRHGHAPPAHAYRALMWGTFGETIAEPIYGAIATKSRANGGHVAFVVGKSVDGSQLFMLGGNQDDEVNISRSARTEWSTFVIPKGYFAGRDSLPVYNGPWKGAGSEI